jgi:hypothetical protein
MIAQPTSPTTTSPLAGLEQEVGLLRERLDEALGRIQSLEQRLPQPNSDAEVLFPIDSQVMEFAKQLCAEIFPGPLEIELSSDPETPDSQWYVLHVACVAAIDECIEKELQFGRRLHDSFPSQAGDIRLLVARQ